MTKSHGQMRIVRWDGYVTGRTVRTEEPMGSRLRGPWPRLDVQRADYGGRVPEEGTLTILQRHCRHRRIFRRMADLGNSVPDPTRMGGHG